MATQLLIPPTSSPSVSGPPISAGMRDQLARTCLDGFGVIQRASAGGNSATGGSTFASVVTPPHVKVGDLILVALICATSVTVTPPAGWTLVRSDAAVGGTNATQYLYSRTATSADLPIAGQAVTYTFNFSGSTFCAWGVNVYFNVAGTAINAHAGNTGNGTTLTPAAATATVADTLVVQFYGSLLVNNYQSFTLATPTNGRTTVRTDTTNGGYTQMASTEAPQSAAGATSVAGTATTGFTATWVVQTVVLAPAKSVTPTLTTQATGGTLAGSATYAYRITAINVQGETLPSNEVTIAVPAGTSTNQVTLSWPQVAKATGYRIYGRTTGAELLIATVTGGSTTSYVDTGSLTPAGALPTLDTTMDSGQIQWAAIPPSNVAPASGANGVIGYEILQFTDALQYGAAPVFIRVEYRNSPNNGNGYYTYNYLNIGIGLGTATDGKGNLTADARYPGSFIAPASMMYNNPSGGANAPMWFDSDGGGSLMVAGWVGANGSSYSTFLIVIERTRDFDGTVNGDGVIAMGMLNPNQGINSAGMGAYSRMLWISAAAPANGGFTQPTNSGPIWSLMGTVLANYTVPANTALLGTTVICYPVFTGFTPKMGGPSKHLVCLYRGDFPLAHQFQITHYGATHTFVHTATQTYSANADTAAPGHGSTSLAFRIS